MTDINRGWTRARPSMQPVKPSGLTGQFLLEPLNFMRRRAMSPPDDFGYIKMPGSSVAVRSGYNDIGGMVPGSSHNISGGKFDDGGSRSVMRKGGGGVFHVKIVPHTAPNFPTAVTLQLKPFAEPNDGSWLPIHWLPWQSLSVVEYQIPELPASEADPSDEEYPRFFFTAGINGCSVFAHGTAVSPVVSHAGVSGANIAGSAGEFWREQIVKTKSGYGSAAIKGEINTHDYMYAGQKPENKKLLRDYEQWLEGGASEFKVEVLSPFGCVFGIRYGRSWTLYLQKSAIFETLTFHKQADVTSDNKLKSTGQSVKFEQARSVFEPRKLGPISFGQKQTKIYSTSTLTSIPMQLMEFFPNKTFVADLKQSYRLTRKT